MMEPLTIAAMAFIESLAKGSEEQEYAAVVEKLKELFAERKPEVSEQLAAVEKKEQEPSPELLESVMMAAKEDAFLMKELSTVSGVVQSNPQLQQQLEQAIAKLNGDDA